MNSCQRNTIIGVIAWTVIFQALPAFAEKYAYVNMQKVLMTSAAGKHAKELLAVRAAKYEAEKVVKEDALKKLKAELEKQSIQLSESARSAQEKDYQANLKDYQSFLKDAQDDLQAKNDSFTNYIVDEIVKVVQKFGKSQGYAYVFALNEGITRKDWGQSLAYKNGDQSLMEYEDVTDGILGVVDTTKAIVAGVNNLDPNSARAAVASTTSSPAAARPAQQEKPQSVAASPAREPEVRKAAPPRIAIISPAVSRGVKLTQKDSGATIIGRASSELGIADVTINGQQASLDADGNFSAELLLRVGDNRITVVATDTGRTATTETFTISRESVQIARPRQEPEQPVHTTGKYFALIIGVKEYTDPGIPSLDQPLQDAQRVNGILTTAYTFAPEDVIFLRNPDQAGIIDALDSLSNRVSENDSLFIFYAGHGYWDEKLKQGYWLPADARKSSRVKWLSNGTIRDYINGIKSKHTLLVADACFSGGIFKTRSVEIGATRAIRELQKYPSRKAMTSGAMKEVPDRSVFVDFLLKRLRENRERFISSEQLFASMRQAVINNSPNAQVPQFGEIRETGDEGGDFVFIKK